MAKNIGFCIQLIVVRKGDGMNRVKTSLIALVLLSRYPEGLPAADLQIDFKADGKSVSVVSLTIEGDVAKAKVGDGVEQFNLKEKSWLDATTGKWVTLAQCEQWSQQSKAKSLSSVQKAPESMRAFLLWSLDPKFKVEKTEDALRLTSGQVDYVIEGMAFKEGAERYFLYAVLNAHKKAITERKLPPFAELKAIEEMRKLGHVPRKVTVTIPGVPKSPKLEIEVTAIKP